MDRIRTVKRTMETYRNLKNLKNYNNLKNYSITPFYARPPVLQNLPPDGPLQVPLRVQGPFAISMKTQLPVAVPERSTKPAEPPPPLSLSFCPLCLVLALCPHFPVFLQAGHLHPPSFISRGEGPTIGPPRPCPQAAAAPPAAPRAGAG